MQLYIDWHENHGFTHDKQNGRVLTFISNILYELTRCFSKILKYTNADNAKNQKARCQKKLRELYLGKDEY